MKHKLLLMCGIPGSGKSTLAKRLIEENPGATYVSRDDIRFALLRGTKEYKAAFSNRETNNQDEVDYITVNYFSKEKEVYTQFVDKIKEGLINSELTIADATHLNEGSRSKLLRALGTSLKDIEVDIAVMQVKLETALKQNDNRKGTISFVPKKSIEEMFRYLTIPIEEEGFDNIYIFKEK